MPLFDDWGPEPPPTMEESLEIEVIRERVLRNDSYREAYELLNSQLNAIHLRATAIISTCGVVVTVTGFSGRLIAGTSTMAQIFVIAGITSCFSAAVVTMVKVMPVRWMTSYMYQEPQVWLLTAIRRRDRKTRFFRFATFLLVLGLALYGVSVAIMLLNPFANAVANAR